MSVFILSFRFVDTAYRAGFVSTNKRKLAWREARNINFASRLEKLYK